MDQFLESLKGGGSSAPVRLAAGAPCPRTRRCGEVAARRTSARCCVPPATLVRPPRHPRQWGVPTTTRRPASAHVAPPRAHRAPHQQAATATTVATAHKHSRDALAPAPPSSPPPASRRPGVSKKRVWGAALPPVKPEPRASLTKFQQAVAQRKQWRVRVAHAERTCALAIRFLCALRARSPTAAAWKEHAAGARAPSRLRPCFASRLDAPRRLSACACPQTTWTRCRAC